MHNLGYLTLYFSWNPPLSIDAEVEWKLPLPCSVQIHTAQVTPLDRSWRYATHYPRSHAVWQYKFLGDILLAFVWLLHEVRLCFPSLHVGVLTSLLSFLLSHNLPVESASMLSTMRSRNIPPEETWMNKHFQWMCNLDRRKEVKQGIADVIAL